MSSLVPQNVSSGSDGDIQFVAIDERKKRRMVSNRESARRSRQRKQQHVEDLLNQITELKKQNSEILQTVNATSQLYVQVEAENSIVRAQMMELSDRLQSLNNILHIAEEVSGFAMDIPEVPDPLIEPWQHLYPSKSIMASADMNMFQF